MDAQELIDAIDMAGLDAEGYSAIAMFGAQCVAVRLEDHAALWKLAGDLVQLGFDIPAPSVDGLAGELIAYWRSVKWPGEQS